MTGHSNFTDYRIGAKNAADGVIAQAADPNVIHLATNGDLQSVLVCHEAALNAGSYKEAFKWYSIGLKEKAAWAAEDWYNVLRAIYLLDLH